MIIIKINYNLFPTFKEIANEVKETTVGIEFGLFYNLIVNYSKYCMLRNRAIWASAPKSFGKGLILNSAINKDELIIKRDKITPTYLTKFFNEFKTPPPKISMILEDISTIIDSDYHTHCFFNLISKLIWDKNYGEGTNEMYGDDNKKTKNPVITVDKLSCHIGGTYEHIYKIKRYYEAYNTFWTDRITEYYIFYLSSHIDKMEQMIFDNAIFESTRAEIPDFNKILPRRETINITISKDIDKGLFRKIFEETLGIQHSYNRGMQYFVADLKAIAYINHRDKIENDDLLFYYLYKPNIGLDTKISNIKILFYSTISDNIDYISSLSDISLSNIKTTAYRSKGLINCSGTVVSPNIEFTTGLFNQEKFIKNLLK